MQLFPPVDYMEHLCCVKRTHLSTQEVMRPKKNTTLKRLSCKCDISRGSWERFPGDKSSQDGLALAGRQRTSLEAARSERILSAISDSLQKKKEKKKDFPAIRLDLYN